MQGFTSNGSARDFFFNGGRINQAVTLGDGNDVFINRNIVANTIDMGAGVDVFDMEAGTVNGNVSLGSGNDQAFIRNGDITNTVLGQDGEDHVVWTGGTIIGLDTGADTDFAHFIGLTPTNLKTGLPVNGGLGSDDVLLWTNTVGDGVARYTNWELFELTDGSELTFDNFATLTLGDSGTGTGTLAIDETSTVFAGNGTHTVAPFASGQLVAVHNWGTIDLTNNNSNATDRFVVQGDYIGHEGSLNLQTFLGSDDSPSDRLVIDGGQGSGATASGLAVVRRLGNRIAVEADRPAGVVITWHRECDPGRIAV